MRSEFRRGDLVAEINGIPMTYTVVDWDGIYYILQGDYEDFFHRFMIDKVVAESDFVRVGREKLR